MDIVLRDIGSSQGIIIPSKLLKSLNVDKGFQAIIENGRLVLIPDGQPRLGWTDAFASDKEMLDKNEDEISDIYVQNQFDKEEWQW